MIKKGEEASVRISPEGGFTLLEVLIAIALTALIFTTIFAVFSNILESRNRAQRVSDSLYMVRLAFDQLTRDIGSVANLKNQKNKIFIGTDRGSGASARDTILFTSLSHHPGPPSKLPESDQVLVEYHLRKEDAKEGEEKKAATYALAKRTETNWDERFHFTRDAVSLAEGIKGVNYRYYDGRRWIDSWNSLRNGGKFPRGVSLEVYLENGERYSVVVPVEAYRSATSAEGRGQR